MDTKLTLKLDKDVIEHAKRYARRHQQSLSTLVERYFRVLSEPDQARGLSDISPMVKELSGIIRLDNDVDIHNEYTTYLLNKYR